MKTRFLAPLLVPLSIVCAACGGSRAGGSAPPSAPVGAPGAYPGAPSGNAYPAAPMPPNAGYPGAPMPPNAGYPGAPNGNAYPAAPMPPNGSYPSGAPGYSPPPSGQAGAGATVWGGPPQQPGFQGTSGPILAAGASSGAPTYPFPFPVPQGPNTSLVVAPTKPESSMSDSHVVAVVQSNNGGQIQRAKLGVAKARDSRVRQYANSAAGEYQAANRKLTEFLTKSKILPTDSPLSVSVTSQDNRVLATLSMLKGNDFDLGLMTAQAAMHQVELSNLTGELLPHAQDPELRRILEEFRPRIEARLREAEKLRQALQDHRTSTPPPSATKKK